MKIFCCRDRLEHWFWLRPVSVKTQVEGLTRDTSPPPANKLYEDNLRLPDDAGKLFLPDESLSALAAA